MASFSQVWLHIVFATKDRKAVFDDISLRNDLHSYLAGIAQNEGSFVKKVGGVEDHIHMLASLPKAKTQSDLVKEIKRGSSIWLKSQASYLADFYWQDGYGAFSVSHSGIPDVVRYIENQDVHHRNMGSRDEYIKFLDLYQVKYDPKYLV